MRKVESNVDANVPEPTHWTRLPMVIWMRNMFMRHLSNILCFQGHRLPLQRNKPYERRFLPESSGFEDVWFRPWTPIWCKRMEKFDDDILALKKFGIKRRRTYETFMIYHLTLILESWR